MKMCGDYNENGHQRSLDTLVVGCSIANKLLPFTPADVNKGRIPFLSFSSERWALGFGSESQAIVVEIRLH